MIALPSFLRRLFRRSEELPEPGSVAEELWDSELIDAARGRFGEETGGGYSARYREGRLELDLQRQGLFAWTEAGRFRYADFAIEGEILLPGPASYGAAGFLFRYVDEANFYLLLVSNRGYFRLDNVFNGSPRTLIAWTELPWRLAAPASPVSLRLIARGSDFTVLIDDSWVGEVVDETAGTGTLAFGAQWYRDGEEAGHTEDHTSLRFVLSSLVLESRPVEVETWYYRFARFEVPAPDARRRLAETFLAMGQYLSAAIQLRKIAKVRSLTSEELFLLAEACLRLELLEDAADALDKCLALDPLRKEALLEKANLLYRRGFYLELRDFAEALPAEMRDSARIDLLEGHALFNLGDYARSADAYARAAALESGQPILRMNEARARELAGDREEAKRAYLSAARGFFLADADDDLALAQARLAALAPGGREQLEIRARMLYRRGKNEEAAKLIDDLVASGSADSTLPYIGGLIRSERGDREAALPYFERAASLEPDRVLYSLRRAEILFLLDRPEAESVIEEALSRNPEEGWLQNLAGQYLLSRLGSGISMPTYLASTAQTDAMSAILALARERLEKAVRLLPGLPEPLMNLAECLSLDGRTDEALALLGRQGDRAEARNLAGNILVREGLRCEAKGDLEGRERLYLEARAHYSKSIERGPSMTDYLENRASINIELEAWSNAEEDIRRALEVGASPRGYLLAANLALVLGEIPRSETACRVGLDIAPDDPALLFALGRAQLAARRIPSVRETLERLRKGDPTRAERLERELIEATTEGLSCASCAREWRVPFDIPAQSASSIRGMPPGEAPAGACPACGKIYCISCRKDGLVDSRFVCPQCGEGLKLSDNRLRWLVRDSLARAKKAHVREPG